MIGVHLASRSESLCLGKRFVHVLKSRNVNETFNIYMSARPGGVPPHPNDNYIYFIFTFHMLKTLNCFFTTLTFNDTFSDPQFGVI